MDKYQANTYILTTIYIWYCSFFIIGTFLSFMNFTFVVVQSLSCISLFATSQTAAWQASLPFTISQSLLKFISIEKMMPSNHLILCSTLLLMPSIFPSIRVFLNEFALCIRWAWNWSFSFSMSPSKWYSGLISLGFTGVIFLLSRGFSKVFSSTTIQKHQFFGAQSFLLSSSYINTQLLEKP